MFKGDDDAGEGPSNASYPSKRNDDLYKEVPRDLNNSSVDPDSGLVSKEYGSVSEKV